MASSPYPLPREARESSVLTGNNSVGPFGPTTFKVFDTADIEVWRKDAGVWTKASGLTIAKTSGLAFDTVSVTFGAVVTNTTTFVILSRRLHERQLAVIKAGTIDVDQLEKEMSRQGTVIQELRRDVNRAWAGEPGTTGKILYAGAEDYIPGYDAAGNLVPKVSKSIFDAAIQAAIGLAAAVASAAASAATAVQAAASAAASAATVAAAILGIGTFVVDTYAVAQTRAFPASVQAITTCGRFEYGDKAGYHAWRRVAVQPTQHAGWFRAVDRYLPNGTIDAANGGYFEIWCGDEANVIAFGGKGDGATNDGPAIVDGAVAYIRFRAFNGRIYFPGVINVYVCRQTIELGLGLVHMWGASIGTTIHVSDSDIKLLYTNNPGHKISSLSLIGKGVTGYASPDLTFGASHPVVHFGPAATGVTLEYCSIRGGSHSVFWEGEDVRIRFCDAGNSYGDALFKTNRSGWLTRNSVNIQHAPSFPGMQVFTDPLPAWASATAYSVGDVVTISGHRIRCQVAGTSGATAPALKNYPGNAAANIDEGPGALRWHYLGPTNYRSVYMVDGATEISIFQHDATGPFSANIEAANCPALQLTMDHMVIGGGYRNALRFLAGRTVNLTNSRIGCGVQVDSVAIQFSNSFDGSAVIVNNHSIEGGAVSILWAPTSGFASLLATGNVCKPAIGPVTDPPTVYKARALEIAANRNHVRFGNNVIGAGCVEGMVVAAGTSYDLDLTGNINAANLAKSAFLVDLATDIRRKTDFFPVRETLLFMREGANVNITTDQALTRMFDATSYLITQVRFTDPTVSMASAVGGLNTLAAKAGTAILADTQTYTELTGVDVGHPYQPTAQGLDRRTATTLFWKLDTAAGSDGTVNIYVFGFPLV